MAPTFIRARNRECSRGARTFTQQTAASIAIVNKCVPNTSPTTSSESGVTAAARRAITFSSVLYFSEKCEWARTSQILARVHQRPRNLRRLRERLVPLLKELRLRRQLASRLHLRPAVRRPQRPRCRQGLRQTHRCRRDSGLALLRLHRDRWRTPLREEAALLRRLRRLPVRHGRSRLRVCRRCILPRGIMCICMRHAASIVIQTCRRIDSSTENDV
jgi:hypothetical protein